MRRLVNTARAFNRLLQTGDVDHYYKVKPNLLRPWFLSIARRRFEAFNDPSERKVFVDGGGNLGQGLSMFAQIFDLSSFDCEIFEPNPHCHDALLETAGRVCAADRWRLHPEAIWISESTVKLFGLTEAEDNTTQGASIMAEHKSDSATYEKGAAIEVRAIDFPQYFKELKSKYARIVVKLDIEGAELDVLEHLYAQERAHGGGETRALFFVEFHAEKLDEPARSEALRRIDRLFAEQPPGFELRRWV